MELSEIEELSKRLLRKEAENVFRLQASASMDMWLCMKRTITAIEHAKKAYEDGCSKVAEACKILQDHTNLVKDKEALERQVKATKAKLSEMRATLDASIQATK
ncbi:unnamed protein product [Prunus armeniaca]